MLVGPSPEWRMVQALAGYDGQVIDAGDTSAHQPVLVEFPILVAVAAEPVTAVVVPLVGETDGDSVITEGPHLLDQAVIQLPVPLAREKSFYGVAALEEFRTIAPLTVDGVGVCHLGGIASVPSIFGHAGLLRRCIGREWRQRWTVHGCFPSRLLVHFRA